MSNSNFIMGQAAAASSTAEGAWDLSYAYYDPPESLTANLSSISLIRSMSVAAEQNNPRDVFFKPDGTIMYVSGATGDKLYEYSLSSPWDLSSETFVRLSNITFPDDPQGIFFKPDGTKMYAAITLDSIIQEYDLSTAWNVSTMSFVQSLAVTSDYLFFKSDGTKMYIRGTSTSKVAEYDLSTAWDISTAVFLQEADLSAQGSMESVRFALNGTVMFALNTSDDLHEYSLSTAWDISTLSYTSRVYDADLQDTATNGFYLREGGEGLYTVGSTGDRVYQYSLGGFSVAAQETTPSDVFFKPDGTKMYILGDAGNDVNEYDLSTAWDVSTASFLQVFSVAGQEGDPEGLFFKPDGTKMYVTGQAGDDVNEYDLSTAWDISTASFLQLFSVFAQNERPAGLAFKPDGTKMYVIGLLNRNVDEYDLSTAWDVSTASYLQTFFTDLGAPQNILFKPDGTKMYIPRGTLVYEHDLSTAWDISTASLLQSFSVANQDSVPRDVFFKPNGTQMFVLGESTDRIYSYTLGPQD